MSSDSKFYIGGLTNANSIILDNSGDNTCDSGMNGYVYKYNSNGDMEWKRLIPKASNSNVVTDVIAI